MTDHTSPEFNPVQTSQLRCIGCEAVCEKAEQNFRCAACGDLLEIVYPGWDTTRQWTPLRSEQSGASGALRDFRSTKAAFGVSVNCCPASMTGKRSSPCAREIRRCMKCPRCARIAGLQQLYAKHQGMNPTGSFKDTGMTMAASVARREGFRWVACASTGNTSASMAAYAARGGMRNLVLIPEGKVSWGKLSQALDYGAVTCQLKTDFDGCMRVLNEVVQRMPVYLLNSVNPYRLEGQKTAAIELMEQFDWEPPDHVIVPGGNLGNSSALGKAFLEMKQLGFISTLPKISIIQAAGANPLVRTMRENGGKTLIPVRAETAASAIRIGSPASWKKAVRVLQATGGTVEQVSEVEIALAKAEIGADGIGCEPASAVTLAGLKKLVKQGLVGPRETVVLILTGHLLKDPEFTLKFHRGDLFVGAESEKEAGILRPQQRAPIVLDADVDAVIRTLRKADERLET